MLQIPSRALRGLVKHHVSAPNQVHWLTEEGMRFRDHKAALNRLTVEQLIRLINTYPKDIPDEVVEAEFKEYRHGRSPGLRLYSMPVTETTGFDLEQANQRTQHAVRRANTLLEQETRLEGVLPRLRELALDPFVRPEDWPDGLHAGYHYQSRLSYIATDGQAASIYQLFYGHVWVYLAHAFVALHVHPATLELKLVQVLERTLQVCLRLVRVDKQLKEELSFPRQASCRRARLVDPNPGRKRFRSITLADDQDLAARRYLDRSYQDWEDDSPEMVSIRYRAQFIGDHDTSLAIGVRRGSLTLSGAVSASDLCAWAYHTGAQIVDVGGNGSKSCAVCHWQPSTR